MGETKTDAVKAVHHPKNLKEVARFLSMTVWYQQLIPNYADLSEPLYELKGKRLKFVWISVAQETYEKLKNTLTEALVLAISKETVQIKMSTDTSAVGLDEILAQRGKATERECLTVILAL